ncbi:MAG: 3-dehydroquinate synthase [Anaerolineales bacterium]|uniref:Multifunctional fusion protein n=1 Tax=Candidatus Desulfolinea nitratireducens TaxID=2841698 RepID=A0A8J6TKJ3_9CHLR|nr:3-dehydroquinate synthase [Candidatus Desulfolinea nitratireducens]MBL6961396.1 3-dehydroquinate synthase [Anaerolineales bacterium]
MTSTIYLYGPPGVGKSTTGKFLAAKLNLPFVDLDGAIERSAGLSIPDIFEKEGEAGFRERESTALKSPRKASIVALGGGALLDRANRNHAEKIGEVICLQAPSKTLAERLQRGKDQRPLLQGNSLKELLDTRSDHYHSFAIQVETDNLTPEESAEVIQYRLGRFYLRGMGKGYTARVENNGLNDLDALLVENGCHPPFFIVSDSNTAPLYAKALARKLDATTVIFPAGEKNKTIDTMTQLWRDLLNAGMERGGTILAIGGGVVNDMAGFAAATIMRGVAWVSIPTSLLSMVDASLGGKTGANLPEGKNLVGAFYPPKLVLADPATLRTLPEAEIRNGLAEVVKHGVIDDPELFSLCGQGIEKLSENWHQLITRAMGVKIRIIEADPFEGGIRAALNFGHTIGHGIESLTQYGLRHGEAVGVGMVVEARLAEKLGIAEAGLADEIAATLVTLGLPVAIPNGIHPSALVAAMQTDKKKSKGVVKFALPVKIGEMRVGVEIKDLERLLEEL